jgi:hypothetical protein
VGLPYYSKPIKSLRNKGVALLQLTCTVKATNKKRSIPVIVRVSDNNDNAPHFENTPYETTVSEVSRSCCSVSFSPTAYRVQMMQFSDQPSFPILWYRNIYCYVSRQKWRNFVPVTQNSSSPLQAQDFFIQNVNVWFALTALYKVSDLYGPLNWSVTSRHSCLYNHRRKYCAK